MDIGHKGPNKSPVINSPFFNEDYNGYGLPPPLPGFILLETGFFILLETGFPILLES